MSTITRELAEKAAKWWTQFLPTGSSDKILDIQNFGNKRIDNLISRLMLDVHLEQDGAGSEDKFIESLTNKIMSIKPINNVINIGSPGSYKAPAEVEAAYDEAGFNGVAQTLFMRKFMNIDVKTGEITANDKNIEGWDNKKVINNLAKTGQLKVPDEGEKEKYDKLMGQVPEKDKKGG